MRLDKSKATDLRNAGYSYNMIASELDIPKSTLSIWLRDLPFTPNKEVIRRIKDGQGKYGLARRHERILETRELEAIGIQEVGKLSRRDLWMVGIGLWIGEGSKTMEQIRLVNSDPRLIRLYMKWLREICLLDDANITVAMHLYPDLDESICKKYWQGITRLSGKQFRKTQIDKRENKNAIKSGKLPYGTLHVTVVSNGNRERGVRLHRRVMGWMQGVYNSEK